MPVCGSVGGRETSGSGMGYHGIILLKTNAGRGGRPDLVGRRRERRVTGRTLISSILLNLRYDGE